MADFCKQHSIQMFGEDTKDFAGLCKDDEMTHVLCEGCGKMIWVDIEGNKLTFDNEKSEFVVDKHVK